MGSLDFGKLTTIVLIFFIISFFFGGKLMYWFDHKDDLQLELKNIAYTKKSYDAMEAEEKMSLLKEISSVCVRKHHVDGLDCTNTAYWLADSLEDKGIDADLAIEWMDTCNQSCQTGKYVPDVYEERNKVTGKRMKRSAEKSEGTAWFWER